MQPQMIATWGMGGSAPPIADGYAARRARAYSVGEATARRREISADAYLFLYKELVGLAGERTYCWPGLDYLADVLETSGGTVKRWMRELERADLIRRKARPGGLTSLTYITAYLDAGEREADDAAGARPGDSCEVAGRDDVMPDDETPMQPEDDDPAARDAATIVPVPRRTDTGSGPLFFGLPLGIRADRPAGSPPISRSVKNHESKDGGCGKEQRTITPSGEAPAEITALLRDKGVLDLNAIAELQTRPVAELEAVSRYVDRQRNVANPAGLFVWLARHDFGATLTGNTRARTARRSGSGRICRIPCASADPEAASESSGDAGERARTWQRVLAALRRSVSDQEYATWLEPTLLLDIVEGNVAIVNTPNVFVRDALTAFRERIAADLAVELGHEVSVEFVIGAQE